MLSLPIDIQILIIPFLTSTSLVSLSQTSQHFRQLINPTRKQLINRLLELECLPENGRGVTTNEQDKIIVPMETASYACTHCLKLLSHTHFDNHALLRLRFRKPPPESRTSQKLCGWTTGDAKAQGLKRQADLRNDTFENWMSRNSYHTIPQKEKLIELFKVGSNRNRRICNECKFTTGFWARNLGIEIGWRRSHKNSNVGTAEVPVVKGRQRRCHDSTERYFWGLFPVAADTEYPWRWKIYREENCDWWTLWWVRCPGCNTWKERAEFRKGSGYAVKATPADPDGWRIPGWDGPHFEEWRCNKCFVASVGEEKLGEELLVWWKKLVEYEIGMFRQLISTGWYAVDSIKVDTGGKYSWEQIVKNDNVSSQLLGKIPTGGEIAKMDNEIRRSYYKILQRWLHGLEDPERELGELMDRHWFRKWSKEYGVLENRIEQLVRYTKLLEANPEKLVRYALDGNPELV